MRYDEEEGRIVERRNDGLRVTWVSGLKAFGGGIGFIVITPRVWGYALVPMGMLLLLFCGLGGVGVWASHHLGNWAIAPEAGFWSEVGRWTMMIALDLAVLAVAMVMALSLAQPLSGFALEAIAHAQEIALTGIAAPKTSYLAALLSTAKSVVVALLVGGSVLAILFVVSFFFPPATVVTVPLKILVCGWMLAWDFIDYPLAMRGVGLEGRFAWVGRNFGAFTLFGIMWALLLVVPGMQLLILPMGVAGATRLVVADDLTRRRKAPILDVLPS